MTITPGVRRYRYRVKRPIEAIQYTGENIREIMEFLGPVLGRNWEGSNLWVVVTRNGPKHLAIYDWVVKGPNGEFFLRNPEEFEATYEEAD